MAWNSWASRDDLTMAWTAPVARIPIGVAIMRKPTTTEELLRTPESISGVSPLPVPSSAGDNRPYISNLAGQLADTRLFAHFVDSIGPAGGRIFSGLDTHSAGGVF